MASDANDGSRYKSAGHVIKILIVSDPVPVHHMLVVAESFAMSEQVLTTIVLNNESTVFLITEGLECSIERHAVHIHATSPCIIIVITVV